MAITGNESSYSELLQDEVILSVMLTSYNCVEYIDAAIGSVVQQYLPFQWELLIGDDGSTDGTLERVNAWAKEYPLNITVFPLETKRDKDGVSGFRAARNRARLLERARGKYLAFLDGDDWLLGKGKFALQIALLDDPAFANCSCAAHRIKVLDHTASGVKYYPESNIDSCVLSPKEYWGGFYFHTNTIVFRRECCVGMLDDKYREFLNDNFITYLVIQNGSVLYTNDEYAVYNRTGIGLWTGMSRTYGLLRNVSMYDLEREINPSFSKVSFSRHVNDFWHLISESDRTTSDKKVKELMSSYDVDRFPTMWLLYNKNSTVGETVRKLSLFAGSFMVKVLRKLRCPVLS